MNKSQLPRLQGHYVRLRPQAKNERGDSIDSDWLVRLVLDDSLELIRADGGEVALIGADHIHEYLSDPSRNTSAARYGFLGLHVQVFLLPDRAIVEPLPPPRIGRAETVKVAAHVETIQEKTKRLAREMNAEQERQTLINSEKGVALAREEIGRLFAALDKLASVDEYGLQFKIAKEPRGRALYLHRFSLSCVWSHSVLNSTRDSRLHVKLWQGNVDFGGKWFADDVRELQTRRFAVDFTAAGQPVWRDDSGGDMLTTEQLVEACVTMLIHRVKQESGPQQKQAESGGLSRKEADAIRLKFLQDGVVRCPRDQALLSVTGMTSFGDATKRLYISCPYCGLSAEIG
jgi:hypothetical protein